MTEQSELVGEFQRESIEAIREAKNLGYNPTYWIRMISDEGGAAAAARKILSTGDAWQDGLTRLYELGRLDLSIEFAALGPKYSSLFTDDQRNNARQRLARVGVQRS